MVAKIGRRAQISGDDRILFSFNWVVGRAAWCHQTGRLSGIMSGRKRRLKGGKHLRSMGASEKIDGQHLG